MRGRFKRLRDPKWEPEQQQNAAPASSITVTDPPRGLIERPFNLHEMLEMDESVQENVSSTGQGITLTYEEMNGLPGEFAIVSCLGASEEQIERLKTALLEGINPVVVPFRVEIHMCGPGFTDLVQVDTEAHAQDFDRRINQAREREENCVIVPYPVQITELSVQVRERE